MVSIRIENPLAFGVGLIGNLLSLLVTLTPMATFYKVYKKKSTGSFQSAPYVVALSSATLWLYYGFLSHKVLLLTINTSTCILESAYLAIYLFYASKKVRRQVAKTKSVEYMPFPLSLFLTLSAIAWFFYGILLRDFYVALPNILGFFFGVAQIILYLIYMNPKSENMVQNAVHMDPRPANSILDLEVAEKPLPVDLSEPAMEGVRPAVVKAEA